MSIAAKAETRPLSDAEVVEAYLTASMVPDPDAAAVIPMAMPFKKSRRVMG